MTNSIANRKIVAPATGHYSGLLGASPTFWTPPGGEELLA
jgi:hypothetical protein